MRERERAIRRTPEHRLAESGDPAIIERGQDMKDHHRQEHHTERFMDDPPTPHDSDRRGQGNALPRMEGMVMHGGPPGGKLWSVGVI